MGTNAIMKFFVKFIMLITLVLTGINVCFSSEIDCSVKHKISKSSIQEDQHKSTNSNSHECKADDCICALTCQSCLLSLTIAFKTQHFIFIKDHAFPHQLLSYSEIFLSQEKPPII